MWETVKLGEIATWVRGLTYSKKDEVDTDGIAVLRATNIDLATHKIVLDEIRYVSETVKVKDDKYTKLGDLLVCTASGSKSHVGKVAIVEEDLGMAFGGFMAAIRCNEHCLPRFLYHVLTSQNFKWHLKSLGDGANINNLKFSQIEEYEIPLPPLAKQQRIVAKLDAAFAEIDRAIEVAESKHTEVEKLKAALLSSMLRGEDWETVKLRDICSVFTDGDWIETKDQSVGGIRLVQTGNVKTGSFADRKDKARYISEETFTRLKCTEVMEGDILVSRLPEPVGRACVIPELQEKAITAVDCTVVRTKKEVLPTYLNYYMQSPQYFSLVQEKVTGATRQRISRKNLGEVFVTLPPLAEQQRIVAKLDAAFAELDRAKASVLEAKAHYQALKSAILAQELQPPQSKAA